ncbi:MAG TPA: DNA polymerase III subunit delta [Xanthomonadaceae bacterium]|jgi:DNA polymerase-3 subunit delta|nr:DNA polymerase III subunit delta [Xanthomonadaceae bacterium]
MQFDDESNLARQLARAPLPPAILIAGVEELRVIEAADAVRSQARAEGYEREVFETEGRFDWDTLAASFSALSLFASSRLLDVRAPSGRVGKEGGEVIAQFCKDPAPGTTLLVTCMDWSKKHAEPAWVRALGKAGHVLTLWATPRHKLPDWLLLRMRARGVDATHEAAELLAERVEGNLLAAAQEVDKLALLVDGKRRIDLVLMEQLVADSARFDAFKLVDACINGDAVRALRILRALRAEGEAVPGLMGPVVQSLLQLATLSAEAARGGDLRAAMNAQRIWDSKQTQFKRALERHDAARWEEFAIEAGRIDRISKGQAAGDAWVALERLLTAVALPRARKLLSA